MTNAYGATDGMCDQNESVEKEYLPSLGLTSRLTETQIKPNERGCIRNPSTDRDISFAVCSGA